MEDKGNPKGSNVYRNECNSPYTTPLGSKDHSYYRFYKYLMPVASEKKI